MVGIESSIALASTVPDRQESIARSALADNHEQVVGKAAERAGRVGAGATALRGGIG